MKDLSSLKKKLAGYSAMVSAMLATNHYSADAQIIYHDIDPDILINNLNPSDSLDLNNDGLTDFVITYSHTGSVTNYGGSSTSEWDVTGVNGASLLNEVGIGAFAHGLQIGNLISEGQNTWKHFGVLWRGKFFMDGQSSSYNEYAEWSGDFSETKYLGIRFSDTAGIHYGWIRLGYGWETIYDYAYVTQTDSSILAGEIDFPTNIKNVATSLLFNAFVQDHQLHIHFNQTPTSSRIILCNPIGEKLREVPITQNDIVMNVNDLPVGIYFVVVDHADNHSVKKVVIN